MRWISMLSPAKLILIEYMNFVVNMFKNRVTNTIAKANLELLCDVETFLGLACII